MLKFASILVLVFSLQIVQAEEIPEAACKQMEVQTATTLKLVNLIMLKGKVSALTTTDGKKPFQTTSAELIKDIEHTFDPEKTKTTIEQFYALLWNLSQELIRQKFQEVSFTQNTVRDVLVASKVFEDHLVPDQIQSIRFDLSKSSLPKCYVEFEKEGVEILLNDNKGFYIFRNGKCQHAKKLIFAKGFSFELKRNQGNLMVANFKGVDLFGDFGNRGLVDIDVNYIALKSAEFFRGTNQGIVIAHVSENEFKHNQHNGFLRTLMRLIPDRSQQPIDW